MIDSNNVTLFFDWSRESIKQIWLIDTSNQIFSDIKYLWLVEIIREPMKRPQIWHPGVDDVSVIRIRGFELQGYTSVLPQRGGQTPCWWLQMQYIYTQYLYSHNTYMTFISLMMYYVLCNPCISFGHTPDYKSIRSRPTSRPVCPGIYEYNEFVTLIL